MMTKILLMMSTLHKGSTLNISRYHYKDGEGGVRDTYLADNNITTYLIEGRLEVTN